MGEDFHYSNFTPHGGKMASATFNHSLEKGLSIIRVFTAKESGLTLSEIAARTGLPIGSAHRYVNTLVSLGYIKKNSSTRQYQLTPKVLELGFAALKGMNLRTRVLPHLLEAADEFKTTTACAILDEMDIVYIERIRSVGFVNLDLSAGSRLPAYCTAMGKVLLAFSEPTEQKRILNKMELAPLTPHTIMKKEKLREELREIKDRGYAFCRQELSLYLESIGAPIMNNGVVEAAISFNLPPQSTTPRKLLETKMIKKLVAAANELSLL